MNRLESERLFYYALADRLYRNRSQDFCSRWILDYTCRHGVAGRCEACDAVGILRHTKASD